MSEKGIPKLTSIALTLTCSIVFGIVLAGCQQQESNTPKLEQSEAAKSDNMQPLGDEETVDAASPKELLDDGFYSSSDDPANQDTASEAKENLDDQSDESGGIASESSTYCINSPKEPVSEITIEKACKAISKRLASVDYESCFAADLKHSKCSSVAGFPILFSEFPPLESRTPKGRILVIGGTHGDELTSVSISFKWIEKLNKYHSGLFHWHVVPMMNPDGVLNRSATRTNNNGVDLNRNMPSDDWEANALRYWEEKQDKNPRRYPGEHAASEPETQWLIDEINSFKPDAIISVHAPYGVVDFDALVLNTAPKSLGKLHLNLLGTYPGSLGNYAGINRNIPVITLELPHAWDMPSEKETTKIWEDIVSWLRKNIGPEELAKTSN